MEYFKSGLKTVLGSQDPDQQPSGAETVERLVERVQSSTLLDDRRDACRALKALSRKYRVEVGAQGMDALRFILETDKADCEIIGYALDTLCNVMSPNLFDEEENSEEQQALLHVGEQFTEMFLKRQENVTLILSFLEEYDFKVRWPALKLLAVLLTNRLRDIQEIILVSPMGVSKLMDLLGDSREVIRNDTLLLLIQLTKSNANIQKIVAFENAFDRLFDVIVEEGCADGGIVVEDCFLLMLNLLKNNSSNQNFFKEGSYIQKLCPMFALPPEGSDETCWGPQKVAILLCVLQVVRCLVSPANPGQVTTSCQKSLYSSGIFQALSSILMASGVPVNFLTEAICTLSEVIRGNQHNQQHFANVMAPINPPREAIIILLMSMVNEKQSFILRCSVLYCFQCYLFKNEVGQAQVVQTLLSPSYEDSNLVTCGQLLCSGLYSHDSLSNWLSAVALSHTLIENPAQRENLLRVLLSPDPNYRPVTLIHQVALLFQQSSKVQSKLGFLILLATWLSHCPSCCETFPRSSYCHPLPDSSGWFDYR
uniref:Vesicle tethering protein Uso1/P115-like head domain-containing protein n=1 Tax=Lygus hesperus TaxID=30085 RepID=A0A0K8SE19_LYGHE